MNYMLRKSNLTFMTPLNYHLGLDRIETIHGTWIMVKLDQKTRKATL